MACPTGSILLTLNDARRPLFIVSGGSSLGRSFILLSIFVNSKIYQSATIETKHPTEDTGTSPAKTTDK